MQLRVLWRMECGSQFLQGWKVDGFGFFPSHARILDSRVLQESVVSQPLYWKNTAMVSYLQE